MKRPPAYRPKCRTCERSRRQTDLMCPRCWALVPVDIQQEINRTVVRGSIRQSDAWTAAVEKAVAAVEAARTVPPDFEGPSE